MYSGLIKYVLLAYHCIINHKENHGSLGHRWCIPPSRIPMLVGVAKIVNKMSKVSLRVINQRLTYIHIYSSLTHIYIYVYVHIFQKHFRIYVIQPTLLIECYCTITNGTKVPCGILLRISSLDSFTSIP